VKDVCDLMQGILAVVFIWTVEVYSLIKNTIFISLFFDTFVVVGFIRWRLRERKQQSTSANQRSFKVGIINYLTTIYIENRFCPLLSLLTQ